MSKCVYEARYRFNGLVVFYEMEIVGLFPVKMVRFCVPLDVRSVMCFDVLKLHLLVFSTHSLILNFNPNYVVGITERNAAALRYA